MHTVTLSITDSNGCTGGSAVKVDYVQAGGPIVDFIGTPTTNFPLNFVVFTDISSSTLAALDTFTWDFGDGQTSTLQNPIIVYTNPGIYTVSLEVTDVSGCTGALTRTSYINILSAPDISITKTGPATDIAGTAISYTLTASNAGPGTATSVVVTDSLPASISWMSDDCGAGPPTGNNLTWSIGDLASGSATTCTINATIASTFLGTATNTAAIFSSSIDTNVANNTAAHETTITAQADLGITKTDSPDPATPGNNLTYTITVTNQGPSEAQNVVVTDTLPSGATLISTSGCAEDPTGVPTCTLGSMAAGGSAQYTITVTVDNPNTVSSLTNSVTVTSDAFDTNTLNNTAQAMTTLLDITPPVITCPINTTIECDTSSATNNTGSATATDNIDTNVVITFSDSQAAGTCSEASTITRTWTATDSSTNSAVCTQLVAIVDTTAPVITCPANVTVECDESTSPTEYGTSHCD